MHMLKRVTLINLLKDVDTRAIIVGGAGSLFVDDAQTTRLVDTPEFPDMFKPTAAGQGRNLQELKDTEGITWTFVSPSAEFDQKVNVQARIHQVKINY